MVRFKNKLVNADKYLFYSINGLHHNYLDKAFCMLTELGGVFFHVLLVLTLTAFPSTRAIGIKLGIIEIVVTLVVQIFKYLVARVRPYDNLLNVIALRTEKDFSFPSGHTATSFACAVFLSSMLSGVGLLVMLLAALIGYSRIYLGVHYPSDVIAGGMIGALFTLILR